MSLPRFSSILITVRRQFSTIRVRFAPSPTGNIHLGGLRTALYNYLFAKKFRGQFILRIEDTDQSRTVPGSVEDIEKYLDWAGLFRDEGPREGGPCGPYLQSLRVDLYRQKSEDLIAAGRAYKCFCSSTRLELLRKQQAKNREPPHYDGKCRNLSEIEIDEKIRETDGRYVIRFAMEPGLISFEDLIFGPIENKIAANVDSDPIILKSDGFPTYHFANVIDDHYMKISHVLRGSEWLMSTAKHLSIYKAFEWDAPKYGHFPLINMEDGKKMSKRTDSSKVKFWLDDGYRPLALANFLTNMGGGLPKDKQDTHQVWSLDKLAENFDFGKISCHPASIDINRLKLFNAEELQLAWNQNPSALTEEFKALLTSKAIETDLTDDRLNEIIHIFIPRIKTLNDLISDEYCYIWSPPKLTWNKERYGGWNLEAIIKDVMGCVNSSESLEEDLKLIANRHGIKWQDLFRLIRKLLTNSDRGLPVQQLVTCLGRQRSLTYLNHGLVQLVSL